MAVLQHELQRILDFAEGRRTVLDYLLLPHNWRYRWEPSDCLSWDRLGGEQRASMAEALWHAERSSTKARSQRFCAGSSRGHDARLASGTPDDCKV